MAGDGQGTIEHGGNLAQADALFPHAPKPWIDLSTGISPHSYPLFELPATALTRLPDAARLEDLRACAALAYGAPSPNHVVAAPGTQSLLPLIAALKPPGMAVIVGPTYAEHQRAAVFAGHTVQHVSNISEIHDANLVTVVNPNNPDGRFFDRPMLVSLASRLSRQGGLLVVDEAFMDVEAPGLGLAASVDEGNVIVLRSFGKFFGLAGLRLGFAIASSEIARHLSDRLGPWAVSGPAVEYGIRALADTAWQAYAREILASHSAQLHAMLARHGLPSTGTTLFRHIRHSAAGQLFEALGQRGIYIRRFAERPDEVRLGLPADAAQFARLDDALRLWRRRETSTEGQSETQ